MKKTIKYLLVIIVGISIIYPISAQQQKKKNAAVLEFVSSDLSKNDVTNLTVRFRALLSQTQAFDMIERDKMTEILKEQNFTLSDNCNSSECAVQIGQLLGVEVMIAGDIGKVGQVYTVDLRMIDVSTGKILQTKSKNYKGEIEGLLEIMEMIANDFAGISSDKNKSNITYIKSSQEKFGTAVFKINTEGVTPVINGAVGNPVFSKDIKLNLPVGIHKIKLTKSGFLSSQDYNIQIKENEEIIQTVDLKEDKAAVSTSDLSLNYGIVSITTSPTGVKVTDGDVEIGTTPVSGLKLSIGSHTLTLKKPKYHSQSLTIDIKDGINRVPEKTLLPNFGTLKINSEPSGAKIKINGILKQGTTPQIYDEYQSDIYEVEVEKDRYFSEKKTVEVKDQQTSELTFRLKPQFSDVTINSTPSGAKVYLDKEYIGTTPIVKKGEKDGILAGTYSLRLSMNSDLYLDYEDNITVKAGEPFQKAIDFKSNFGTIKIIADKPDFKVLVNGIENTELCKNYKANLSQGNYEIEIIKDKYQPVKKSITLSQGMTETINVQFIARQGRIIAYSVPDGADIILIDEMGKEIVKSKNIDQMVLIGSYTIKAQLEGYGSIKTKTIMITDGYKEPIELTFTDEDKMPSISITTDPAGADVYFDSKLVGKSPIIMKRATPGEHNIKVTLKKDGKQLTSDRKINVKTGEFTKINLLIHDGKTTKLYISTLPSEAEITLNGKYIGKSPITIDNIETSKCKIIANLRIDGKEMTAKNYCTLQKGDYAEVNLILEEIFGTFTDPRDDQTYKTVKIGDYIWMAENLNYDAGKGSKCYDNTYLNCDNFGRLYDWETAKKVAPLGWRLPTKTEFDALLSCLGGEGLISYKEIIAGGSSEFNLSFGGWQNNNGKFLNKEIYANLWSATSYDNDNAWYLDVSRRSQKTGMYSNGNKKRFLSVRLLKFSDSKGINCYNELYENFEKKSHGYNKMSFGYNKCNVKFEKKLHEQVSLDDMIKLAHKANAKGFTYQSELQYGYLMIGEYPEGCKSPAGESWSLYLLTTNEQNENIINDKNNDNSFTDPRDGKTYKTVKIGNQVWMAENLNYVTKNSYCYNFDQSNCNKYGCLYDRDEAKKAIPTGWHLPSRSEFEQLINYLGGEKKSYQKLINNGASEFNALLGGYHNWVSNFNGIGSFAVFLSSDNYDISNVWYLCIDSISGLSSLKASDFMNSYSVRLIKD